jgi:hypothetical protein
MVSTPSPLSLLIEKNRLLRHERETSGGEALPFSVPAHASRIETSGSPVAPLSRELMDSRVPHVSAASVVVAELSPRVAAFRQQLDEWTASGRLGAPVLALPAVGVALGRCVSCAATLAEGRTWRCALCLRAVEVVLGLAAPP